MNLINFDTELDRQGVSRLSTAVEVKEEVTVTLRRSESRSYLGKSEWDWHELRDYVIFEIEERQGPVTRDLRKESGIFKSFLSRWGDKAQKIALYAFERADGVWRGQPISVTRFCKGSDPYFAQPIVERLVDQPVKDW